MRNEINKGVVEIELFRRFVDAAELPIDLSSIEKRDPPEPDILCQHLKDGPIHFELVELCDPNIAHIYGDPVTGVNVMWTANPTRRLLTQKTKKSYICHSPLELLCYTAGRIGIPDDTILPTIVHELKEYQGLFRRVWFYGVSGAHMVWEANSSNLL